MFEAGLGGVVAAHSAGDAPDLVVIVGTGYLELHDVGCRIGGRDLPARFQGCGHADGLHRGSDLSTCTDGQVHLGVVVRTEEVATADHGQDLAGAGLENHDGRVRVAATGGKVVLHGLFGGRLEVQVDRGLDPEAALEQESFPGPTAGAERRVVQEPAAYLLHEVPGRVAGLQACRVLLQPGRHGGGRLVLLLRDVVVGQHAVQHHVAALQALGVVQEGVVAARQLDDPGDQRRLGEVQLGHVLVEVGLRCRLHPVRTVAQVHGVQVLQQDEVLAVLVLQPGGVPDLLQLAAGRLFGIADDGQLHVLLRDGGSALADASRLQVGACCPDDGLQVEAVVDVEALVLYGDDGVADHLGDLLQGAGAGAVLRGHERDDVASVAGHHRR